MHKTMRRIAESPFTLAVGDVALLLLFTAVGRWEHHIAVFAPDFFITALPLIVSWLVFAGALGALSSQRARSPLARLGRTTLAWVIACPVAIAVRARILERPISVIFLVVTFGMVWLLLAIWRELYRHLFQRFAHSGSSNADTPR